MKKLFFLLASILFGGSLMAQNYPEPEFSNEVYYLNKNDSNKLVRLEKGSAEMNTSQGAFKGSEASYSFEGARSPVRLSGGRGLSFIISSGSSNSNAAKSSIVDSAMIANGIDPSMLPGTMGQMNDPARSFTLYKMEANKVQRKIIVQKTPGINPFGSHKIESSDKYSFSAKKIREGYWELVIDKPLPRGEYAFTMMGMGMQAMDGGVTLFAFGVD